VVERDEEQIGRLFGLLLSRTQKQSSRIRCLDEESLGAYLQGHLNAPRRRQIEEHLAVCAFCVDEVVAAHQTAQQSDLDTVPQPVLKRVIGLMPSTVKQIDVLNLVVRLLRDTLELVTTSGELVLATTPAAIRGKSPASRTLQVAKDLDKVRVTVEVERTEAELCQVTVNVTPTAGALADEPRLSLWSADREQASYLARQGTVIFDRVSPGEYHLAVFESGNSLGAIRLTIKEYRDE
jgi:hypothetical protein